jgi:hypothetical protein
MKKILLLVGFVLTLLLYTIGVKAQTTQPQLDPVEFWIPLIGTWQASVGPDSVEVWDYKLYGKAAIIDVYRIIKDKKNPLYINSISYDSKDGRFKGFVLWNNGGYNTWIGTYNAEKKTFNVDIVDNLNPETVWYKFERVLVNPQEWTWTAFDKDGVKQWENKYIKVK